MKKMIVVTVIIVLGASIAISLVGCSGTPISEDDAWQRLQEGITNSLKAELFYWKDFTNDSGSNPAFEKKYLERIINVYGIVEESKTDVWTPVKNVNGEIDSFTIFVRENTQNSSNLYETIMIKRLHVGQSKPNNGDSKSYIFRETLTTDIADSSREYNRTKEELDVYSYYNSEEFAQYKLDVMLKEIIRLKKEDLIYDFKNGSKKGGAKSNGVVTTLTFKVSESYTNAYKEEFGEPSRFDGSDWVVLEITANRIAQILVVERQDSTNPLLRTETEPYKLNITYLGPKIRMPKYDKNEWWDDTLA
ncbi:MAG: hypothetical protein LBE09_04530 [Christensenellaceae bacterium]|jgi:hypothetical protein|nr:hypothetical protein [Christensenellaceae bacterium]